MKIIIKDEKFRVDFEGGTYCPGDYLTPPDYEPINILKIEWLKGDRYIDVTGLLESEFLDEEEFEEAIVEQVIEVINTPYEP